MTARSEVADLTARIVADRRIQGVSVTGSERAGATVALASRTAAEVDAALAESGTTMLVVNSICGCAAGKMRPGVRLALQNGTVDAQENPLTTIEAKKFYEVQKNIILTGHIVDSLATQVAPHVWNKLSDADKKVFVDVTREAAANATADIKKRESELADEFRKKGLNVHAVDKKSFQDAILKNVSFESMGVNKADWDRIQAIK